MASVFKLGLKEKENESNIISTTLDVLYTKTSPPVLRNILFEVFSPKPFSRNAP